MEIPKEVHGSIKFRLTPEGRKALDALIVDPGWVEVPGVRSVSLDGEEPSYGAKLYVRKKPDAQS